MFDPTHICGQSDAWVILCYQW